MSLWLSIIWFVLLHPENWLISRFQRNMSRHLNYVTPGRIAGTKFDIFMMKFRAKSIQEMIWQSSQCNILTWLTSRESGGVEVFYYQLFGQRTWSQGHGSIACTQIAMYPCSTKTREVLENPWPTPQEFSWDPRESWGSREISKVEGIDFPIPHKFVNRSPLCHFLCLTGFLNYSDKWGVTLYIGLLFVFYKNVDPSQILPYPIKKSLVKISATASQKCTHFFQIWTGMPSVNLCI